MRSALFTNNNPAPTNNEGDRVRELSSLGRVGGLCNYIRPMRQHNYTSVKSCHPIATLKRWGGGGLQIP